MKDCQRKICNTLNMVKDPFDLPLDRNFYGNIQGGNDYVNTVAVLKTDLDAEVTQGPGWLDHVDLVPLVWPYQRRWQTPVPRRGWGLRP